MSFASLFKRRPPEAPAPSGEDDLFDEDFQRKLDSLALVSRRVFAGRARAERRTKKSGSGIEFADHREYVSGDDLRSLDWSVYERFGRLLVRLYEEEEDLSIDLVVDTSASMGLSSRRKLRYAKQLAASLAYIGLSNLDKVSLWEVNSQNASRMPPVRGKAKIFQVLRFLRDLSPRGETDLEETLRSLVSRNKRRGLVVLFSDLYDERGFERGLNALRYAKYEVFVVHIVDRDDREPGMVGDVTIVDSETGESREVTVTPKLLERYREAYDRHLTSARRFSQEHQIPYIEADVSIPFDDLVLRILRQGGFLR